MAIDSDTVELSKTVVGAGTPIDCAMATYLPEWIYVYYGTARIAAVYNTDYTVSVAGDFESFTVTPTASLVTKLNNLGQGNNIKVARYVPTTNDFTETDAFVRAQIVSQFNKISMALAQMQFQFQFVPEDFATNIQQALDAVALAQAAQVAAAASATTAGTQATNAAASAATATTQAGNAATSAATATTQAGTATTQATNAAASAASAAAYYASITALSFVIHGNGAPSNGTGLDTWYYIDDVAKKLYGPKAAGVWPAGIDMTAASAVSGPGTSTNGAIPEWNGTTGLVLKVGNARVPGAANGLATLDSGGLIPSSQLPLIAITDTFVVASQVAMLALTAEKGDVAIRTDQNKSYILSSNSPGTLADWKELLTPTDAVLSVAGLTGAISALGLKTALAIAYADITGVEPLGEYSNVNNQTGTTYTFALTDKSRFVSGNNAGAITWTIPPNSSVAFPVNSRIDWWQKGAGQITFAPGAGVTIRSAGGRLKATVQYSAGALIKLATDEWLLTGDITT